MTTIGHVVSVNVGEPREVNWHGRVVTTAIWKQPVSGHRRIRGVNIEGDDQADRRVHGGPTKAVYAYAAEDYAWWGTVLGVALDPGTFGDNLTVTGVDLVESVIGERWRIGSTLVTRHRATDAVLQTRCTHGRRPLRRTLRRRRPTRHAPRHRRRWRHRRRQSIELVHRPDHDVTIGVVDAPTTVIRSCENGSSTSPTSPRPGATGPPPRNHPLILRRQPWPLHGSRDENCWSSIHPLSGRRGTSGG